MNFEKWQALGNDYVIVEGEHLDPPLNPPRVRRLCDRHTGIGAVTGDISSSRGKNLGGSSARGFRGGTAGGPQKDAGKTWGPVAVGVLQFLAPGSVQFWG